MQKSRPARLLRRAVEAALALPAAKSPPGAADAIVKRIAEALPPERAAHLLMSTDVDSSGRRRRCRFNPSRELFAFRSVVTPPWDTVWMNTPLVLHDFDLLPVVDFTLSRPAAMYLQAEPHEHGETIAKILEKHPGPVESLRVDASKLPAPEMLGRWLDLLSKRFVTELVLLDVGAPPAPALKELPEFPLSRLQCPGLARLALGFVALRFRWCCSALSSLEELYLVFCSCSGRDLSGVVANLEQLKTLAVFGVDLAPAGAGAAAAAAAGAGDGALDITSESLSSLELMEAKATALILRCAPALKNLVAGVFSPEVKNDSVRPSVSIRLWDAPQLQSISGLALWRRQRIPLVGPLSRVETLEAALEMLVTEQWNQLLNLATHLPGLRCLDLTRIDDRRGYEELEQLHPACFRDSLQELRLKSYRAGDAEVSLVTKVLASAEHLVRIDLYPHGGSLQNQDLAHVDFDDCPRASAAARVYSCYPESESSEPRPHTP